MHTVLNAFLKCNFEFKYRTQVGDFMIFLSYPVTFDCCGQTSSLFPAKFV